MHIYIYIYIHISMHKVTCIFCTMHIWGRLCLWPACHGHKPRPAALGLGGICLPQRGDPHGGASGAVAHAGLLQGVALDCCDVGIHGKSISHHLESMGNRGWQLQGESSFQGLLGGAKWISSGRSRFDGMVCLFHCFWLINKLAPPIVSKPFSGEAGHFSGKGNPCIRLLVR